MKTFAVHKQGPKAFFPVALFFLFSGVTGLVMQVVWMYKLGLVFGNAAYATATTLTSFFLGLAVGGKYWGNKSARVNQPLRLYGILELGIALSALLVLPGIAFYQNIYADVVLMLGENRTLLTLIKFLFSLSVLFVPTLLMGGTFPVLAQFIGQASLASRGTMLYTLNTLGAAGGTFLAGFFLFIHFGVQGTYIGAVCLAGLVGLSAIVLDFYKPQPTSGIAPSHPSGKPAARSSGLSVSQFRVLAFGSGVLALATETAWIKMFTQVLQNSVYSFSVVLVAFLLSLALGGALAHYLVRRSFKIQNVILFLLILSTLLVGWTPRAFDLMTNGLTYVGLTSSWIGYLKSIFLLSIGIIAIPGTILGTLFPYLLKSNAQFKMMPGNFVGRMVFLNSIGSAIGPVLVGFIIIDLFGIWQSVKLLALGYGLLGLYVLNSSGEQHAKWKYVIAIVPATIVLFFGSPPLVRLQSGEQLLESWQSSDGIITVVKSESNLDMRLNNTYVLGDTQSALVEQMQAHIPLLIHHDPKRTLFLGMGTGVTAGAALNHDVEMAEVVEIVPDVIPASRKYFAHWTNGLFTDPRVKIVKDDARNYLLGSNAKYDVIVGDLFSPWHSGTGGMYTLEHFQMVKDKLDSGGVFAQWLPLFQLTRESFESIVSTFDQVFATTTFWRADFSGDKPSIALIGQQANARLDNEVLLRNVKYMVSDPGGSKDHMSGLFYLGNYESIRAGMEPRINNDDQRTIEFLAPIRTQQANAGETSFLIREEQENLFERLSKIPVEKDPYLQDLPSNELDYVRVGRLYFKYLKLQHSNPNKADKLLKEIRALSPDFI